MPQAGLFSAVASAFIIEVNSQLQPDPNEETVALLRVLIYKVDNATFGDNIPTIPQPWTGPPHMIIQVQAILFASLAASLFSAFLAMLGKQWLNRYESVDMRGSAIKRSQNRQRKLDGIDSWYFDRVMESLPLMLQVALLLLGCALSRYLWEINKTIASVVLGFTSFGVLFYLFIVIAGTTSISCPYQTPGAHILRHIPDTLLYILNTLRYIPGIYHHILDIFCHIPDTFHHIPHILSTLSSTFSALAEESYFCVALVSVWDELKKPPYSLVGSTTSLLVIFLLPIWLILDVCRSIILLLVAFSHWVYIWLQQRSEQLRLQQESEQQVAVLDLPCVLWALRTSLDRPVRTSTLSYLATIPPTDFDPTVVVDCFDILFGCVKVINDKVTITQGSEQLAIASALCCLHTLSRFISIGPMPRAVGDTYQRYRRAFGPVANFNGLPVFYIMNAINSVFFPHYYSNLGHQVFVSPTWWDDCKPSSGEHIIVAYALTKVAQIGYQRRRTKVPCWLLRFALHSLSQFPPPPTPVIISSLSIVAIDLGCGLSNTTTLEERCVCI